MRISLNNIIQSKYNKPILLDYGFKNNGLKKPVILFAHGFKGFKDWGHFNKVMEHFIENDFVFVKFNFSHNGGTVEQPIDFPDLEAFGNNNYTKELDDLRTVTDWIEDNEHIPAEEINTEEIYLIGHSRGGGISVISASEDKRIKKLVTWAAVADLINRIPESQLEFWKEQGVIYVENARTKQQMPMYYQFVEDTLNNKERLTIENAARKIDFPHLIIHGTNDKAVDVTEAHNLAKWNSNAELFIIEDADHVFGASHPFIESGFPADVKLVLEKTIQFFK
ncbi:prolyl oligopeptidase family serine peptidase [Vicingus serpentipes]|uniref:Prolyl oligopeptidase family serine peptidase n=1 Tax=Vicingus serpentipes TaxID=1926625 RepID=A0A5C6RXH8_9FLAO|nr:alpha/beta fold hydrolase [Vicingus serpentipes]TXB67058.1 prolyl oligopeptidase family serine peptidase [Vicingus serpentipes]